VPGERVTRGAVVVDIGRHEVLVDGAAVAFTATQLKLLHHLASHPGRVFTRDQLLDSAVGSDAVITDRNVDVHMRAIRQKLGAHAQLIETVRGVGYRFADS
jgi:two-component system phosphate regulon response regulator PhoB